MAIVKTKLVKVNPDQSVSFLGRGRPATGVKIYEIHGEFLEALLKGNTVKINSDGVFSIASTPDSVSLSA